MHQIRFRLGLRPGPGWGSSQRSPDPLAGFKEVLLLREGKGMGWKGRGNVASWLWGGWMPQAPGATSRCHWGMHFVGSRQVTLLDIDVCVWLATVNRFLTVESVGDSLPCRKYTTTRYVQQYTILSYSRRVAVVIRFLRKR